MFVIIIVYFKYSFIIILRYLFGIKPLTLKMLIAFVFLAESTKVNKFSLLKSLIFLFIIIICNEIKLITVQYYWLDIRLSFQFSASFQIRSNQYPPIVKLNQTIIDNSLFQFYSNILKLYLNRNNFSILLFRKFLHFIHWS